MSCLFNNNSIQLGYTKILKKIYIKKTSTKYTTLVDLSRIPHDNLFQKLDTYLKKENTKNEFNNNKRNIVMFTKQQKKENPCKKRRKIRSSCKVKTHSSDIQKSVEREACARFDVEMFNVHSI